MSNIIKKWNIVFLLVIFISLLIFYLKTKKISRFQDTNTIKLNYINTLNPVLSDKIELTKWSENSKVPLLALLLNPVKDELTSRIKIFKKDEIFFKNFEEIALFEDTNNEYYEENKIKNKVEDINFSKHPSPILAVSSNRKILLWQNQYDSYRFINVISLDDMTPPKMISRLIRNIYDEKWSRYSDAMVKKGYINTERKKPKYDYGTNDEISSVEWSPNNLLTIGVNDGSIQLFDSNLIHKQTISIPILSDSEDENIKGKLILKWSNNMLATYLVPENDESVNNIYIWKYNDQQKLEIIDYLEHESNIKSINWCNIKDTPILTVTENKKLYFWKQKNKTSKFRIIESDRVDGTNSLLSWSNNKTNPILVIYNTNDNKKIDIWKYDSNKKSLDKLELSIENNINTDSINIEWSPHTNPLLTIGNTNIFNFNDIVMENIEYEDPITGQKYKHKHVDIDPIRKGTQLRKGISLTPINNYIIQRQAPPKLPIYPDSQGKRQATLQTQLVKATLPPQLVKTTLPTQLIEETLPPYLVKATTPQQIFKKKLNKNFNYKYIYILIVSLIITSLLIAVK